MMKKRLIKTGWITSICATMLVSMVPVNGQELTQSLKPEVGETLYSVNCGASGDAKNVYPGGVKGSLQSVSDQEYGNDDWGYVSKQPDSSLVAYQGQNTDPKVSFWYLSDTIVYDEANTGIKYDFKMPETNGTYVVTVGFQNPWATKKVDIEIEGNVVESGVSATRQSLVEKEYTVQADEILNFKIKAHGTRKSPDDDPILNYLIIKEAPTYTKSILVDKIKEIETSIVGKEYSEITMANLQQIIKEANDLIDTTDSYTCYLMYQALENAYANLKEIVIYDKIMGTDCDQAQYTDNNGEAIQAHGGQIQKWGNTYYWYGEDKSGGLSPVGVHLYTSTDLYNWTDQGRVLKTMESKDQFNNDEYFKNLYGDLSREEQDLVFRDIDMNSSVVERPKVIYNETTGKYIMWFHADGPYNGGNPHSYWKAMAAVAIADKPEGPFKLISGQRLHTSTDYTGDQKDYGMARDMNLFIDEGVDANNDGVDDAYIIYSSENNATMYISRLNADYTDLDKVQGEAIEGTDFSRNFVNSSREAPAMFKYKDKYYLITSGCTGWNPNPAKYAVANSPLGPWIDMGDPCVDSDSQTTYHTQSTCVVPIDPENGKYMYMGDRWYNPDNGLNVGDSRYVWLPIEFGKDYSLILRQNSNWTLDQIKANTGYKVISKLSTDTTDIDKYMKNLPDQIEVEKGNKVVKENVTWSKVVNADGISAVVTGKFGGDTFTMNVNIYPDNTVYFFDCATNQSDYVDTANELIKGIKNDTSDQKYVKGSWGYTSVTQTENPNNYDVGSHSGNGVYENGWWAASNKAITYRAYLEPGTYTVQSGYQEWWSATREMKFSVSSVNENNVTTELNSTTFTTWSSTKAGVQRLSFKLTEATEVEIKVSKVSGGDPVVSYFAIYNNDKKDPEFEKPTTIKVDYGTKLKDIDLGKDTNGTFQWASDIDTDQLVGECGEHQYNVTYVPNNQDKYNSVTFKTTIKVEPIDLTIKVVDQKMTFGQVVPDFTYEIITGQLVGNDKLEIKYSCNVTSTSLPGEYSIMAVATNKNYQIKVVSGIVKVAKAPQNITIGTIDDKIYGDIDFEIPVNGVLATSQTEYEVVSGDAVSINQKGKVTIIKAGTVVIKVTNSGDEYYNETSATITITIAPKDVSNQELTISGIDTSYDYTGNSIKPVISVLYAGNKLKEGIDYTIVYGENIKNLGTVRIDLIGNYHGSKMIQFNISDEKIEKTPIKEESKVSTAVKTSDDMIILGYLSMVVLVAGCLLMLKKLIK